MWSYSLSHSQELGIDLWLMEFTDYLYLYMVFSFIFKLKISDWRKMQYELFSNMGTLVISSIDWVAIVIYSLWIFLGITDNWWIPQS